MHEENVEEWKVGELAERIGLTVRTLHHYEERGLLCPRRNSAGHRRYGSADLQRLQQILSLRQLGFSLDEIHECLERSDFTPQRVIERHLALLDQQLELQRRLHARLSAVARSLKAAEPVSAETFVQTIEATLMIEKHYTPEQLAKLQAQAETVGSERIEAVQQEWQELFDQLRQHLHADTPADDPRLDSLIAKSAALIREFTGGDQGIEKSLGSLYREKPTVAADYGMNVDAELMAYYGKAQAARRPS